MSRSRTTRSRVAAALSVAAAFTCSSATAAEADDGSLQDVKAATARYHSIGQAVADGYVLASPCASSPLGGMGFHYENHALMSDPAIDPERPEILLYAPGPSGNLELVGIEYWRADSDGNPATSDGPSLFGAPFNGPCPVTTPACPCTTTCTSGCGRPTPRACSPSSTRRSAADLPVPPGQETGPKSSPPLRDGLLPCCTPARRISCDGFEGSTRACR